MKALAGAYMIFGCGVGLCIANHEQSLWLIFWKCLVWPGYAGYEAANFIFHYAR